MLTFTTLNSYHSEHKWFLLNKNLYRGLVEIKGWVTDDQGNKHEFENLYGVIDLFKYRG